MAGAKTFERDRDYNNVYFLKVDAKGHSGMVSSNDADKANHAFDEFEKLVYDSVEEARRRHSCTYAESWGWQGDGGLCILYDDLESKSREATLEAADIILRDIHHLNAKLKRHGVIGEVAVRIAIHKGSIRYKGDERRGSIHSVELNWCAHLESATPINTIALSDPVYRIMGDAQAKYTLAVGQFEGQKVYLKSDRGIEEIQEEWRRKAGGLGTPLSLESDIPVHDLGLKGVFSQRALTERYTALVAAAKERIWAAGVGLGGFQHDHFATVKQKVLAGVDVRLLISDATTRQVFISSEGHIYSPVSWWDAHTGQGNINKSSCDAILSTVEKLNAALANEGAAATKRVQLRSTVIPPTAAVFIVDSQAYLSLYLRPVPSLKNFTFLVTKNGRMYDRIVDHFSNIWQDSERTLVLSPL